jgi:hypothetical protein
MCDLTIQGEHYNHYTIDTVVGIYHEMKIFSSNNQSYKGIFNYFFLIVEGHSKHYFSYIMPEYQVITSCHKKLLSKWEGRQHKAKTSIYKTLHRKLIIEQHEPQTRGELRCSDVNYR